MSKNGSSEASRWFKCPELSSLYQHGQMDTFLEKYRTLINSKTFLVSGGDVSVFKYQKDHVLKVAPKTLRFFKHFGKHRSGKDFKKYINRLSPYFIPVEEILYENEYFFVYQQQKCHLIESNRIDAKVVIDVFRLIQFMLVNDILLTDLAPHNMGLMKGHVVVFDYHGLHRLTEDGKIKRPDWWRRLARNLTRFICGFYCPKKRAIYSQLMQDCDEKVIQKLSNEPEIPKCFVQLVEYMKTHQDQSKVEEVCEHLEKVIKYLHH